jgi:hypothetical protein
MERGKDMKYLSTLKEILPGWANQMYARFGHPVYLVGSCLNSDSPRDVDIRIILPDDEFEGRYGSVAQWREDAWCSEWREPRQKWAKDMAKLSREISKIYVVNVDLQVYPKSYSDKYFSERERYRIDTINDN